MPLCDYEKELSNRAMIYHGKITGTAMLINKTNFVIIDVDNKGNTIEEREAIFENLCKTFLPSSESTDETDIAMHKYLYAE